MIAIGFIQVAILLVSLVRSKGLAILMGPEGVGVIGAMDQFIVTVTQVAAFGVPIAAMKFMSAAHSVGDDAFRDSFAAFVRVILVLAILAIFLGIGLHEIMHDLVSHTRLQDLVLLSALLNVPPMMLTILIAHTLAAAQSGRGAAVYNLCFLAAAALSGLTGAWLGGIPGFYFGAALTGFAVVASGLAWLRWRLGLSILREGVSIRRQITLRPKFFGTALTASISLVSFAVSMLLVRYIVLARMGEESTGYLQAALALALSLGSVLGAINALLLAPAMNREQPNAERFQRASDFVNRVVLLAMAGAVPLALLPGLGLTILFTSEFVPAGMAVVLCLIWQLAHQFRISLLQLLIGADHPLSGAFAVVCGLGVTLGVTFALVAEVGILAAPIGLILGDIVAIGVMLVFLRMNVEMSVPWTLVIRLTAAALAILMAGLLFDPTHVLPDLAGMAQRLIYALAGFVLIWVTMPSSLAPSAALVWLRNRRDR